MKTASFKRVIRAGVVGFWRNLVVSLACVLVTTVAMLIIGSLFLGNVLLNSSIDLVKDRVDINIYFKTDAGESDIMAVKDSLVKLPEVKMVEYTSREDAITAFKEKHKNNSLIIESLDELKSNPLGAVLSVKAKDPSQ
ncbi:MAG: permease-like cell division protein FtsX, partial [Candidatus Paceibacterota bacterium]